MKATGKNLSKLLLEFRNSNNMTQKEASEALGMSLRMYTGYETGEFEPKGARLEKYLHKLASYKVEVGTAIANEPAPKYKKTVPVYDLQAQGSNVTSFDDDLSELPKSYVQVPGFEDCSFAVYVWNHSMYPTYENGCMVIVKEIKRKEAIQYGSVYLLITDEQRVVKRLYEDEDPDQVVLASDNPETRKDGLPKYPSYKVKKKVIRKIFLIKGTIKRTEI